MIVIPAFGAQSGQKARLLQLGEQQLGASNLNEMQPKETK